MSVYKLFLFVFTDDVRMRLINKSFVLENTQFNSHPAIIHGNGLAKLSLNSYTNYIPNQWSPESGCSKCKDSNIDLSMVKVTINYLY